MYPCFTREQPQSYSFPPDFPDFQSQPCFEEQTFLDAPAWSASSVHHSRQYIAVSSIIVFIGTLIRNNVHERVPMVARVSLIDYCGNILLDTYVRPTHYVEDFRTESTGLNYTHLENAPSFATVQHTTARTIHNNIIVGHRLWEFLSIMGLSHPAIDTRDLALFRPLRKKLKSRCIVSLRTLVRLFIRKEIGMNYEDSLEIARASMDLFLSCQELFEGVIHVGAWPCDLPPISFARYFL